MSETESKTTAKAPGLFRRLTTPVIVSCAVTFALLISFNVLLHVGAATSQRRQMIYRLNHLPQGINVTFLGNSLMEAGCDLSAFSEAAFNSNSSACLNLALGATSPVEHCLILERAFRNPSFRPRYLIYGFFDDQLNAKVTGHFSDLIGNRALSYYFPQEAASLYEENSFLTPFRFWLIGHLPMFLERSSLWAKVELLRRKVEEIGMPPHKTNRFGRVDDFAALEAADLPAFVETCSKILQSHRGLSLPVQRMLKLAHDHGTRVIIVEMPMPAHHRNTFYSSPVWEQMRTYLQTLIEGSGATYLCASDWVSDDSCFQDATHLNENGAKVFSSRLGKTLADENHPIAPAVAAF
jgi:hypothetical protein